MSLKERCGAPISTVVARMVGQFKNEVKMLDIFLMPTILLMDDDCALADLVGSSLREPGYLMDIAIAHGFSEGIAWTQSVANAKVSPHVFDAIETAGKFLFSQETPGLDSLQI